jgi:hypothetical protein
MADGKPNDDGWRPRDESSNVSTSTTGIVNSSHKASRGSERIERVRQFKKHVRSHWKHG